MSSTSSTKPMVLLVEDNPDDQDLACYANARLDHPWELRVVEDGVDALDYLAEQHPGSQDHSGGLPDLLLVDLAMPRMDGLTLLSEIRKNPVLRKLPVVMFTTSTAERDVLACYENGCNSYMVKPMAMKELAAIFTELTSYWFGCVRRPA